MSLKDFLDEWNNGSTQVNVHTSGSTGRPKNMLADKQKMRNSARITCDFLGLKPGDTALLCMKTDFIAGKMMVVRSLERGLHLYSVEPSGHPLRNGQPCELMAPDGRGLIDVERMPERFDFVAMVPLQVYNTLRVPEEAERLRASRHLIIGGGAIDDGLQRQLVSFPNCVWSTYGMTETLSHIALRRLNGPAASCWYKPFPSVQVSLGAGGCLVVHAPLVHAGDLVTRDRAEVRADGCFRILGRLDNVIDSGGIKIQIEEVEQALKAHLCAPFMITRVRDAKFGEAVALLTEDDDTRAVASVCRNVLPKYWVPRHFFHLDHLPLTPTGKPARKDAEREAAAIIGSQGPAL